MKKGAISAPTATRAAPVSVAIDMIRLGLSSLAKANASARTRRPSASVLLISTVDLFLAVRMSPGRNEFPEIEFSTAGISTRS